MILCDRDIRKLCVNPEGGLAPLIAPFLDAPPADDCISAGLSSCGYDLRLAHEIRVFKNTFGGVLDPKKFRDPEYVDRVMDKLILLDGDTYDLPSGGYILARSVEWIDIPSYLCARIMGKSTYARCEVHVNTTPAEPGWRGHLTLEISNPGPLPVRLYPGEGIAQIQFEVLAGVPDKDYSTKDAGRPGIYQDQVGVTPARVRG